MKGKKKKKCTKQKVFYTDGRRGLIKLINTENATNFFLRF